MTTRNAPSEIVKFRSPGRAICQDTEKMPTSRNPYRTTEIESGAPCRDFLVLDREVALLLALELPHVRGGLLGSGVERERVRENDR